MGTLCSTTRQHGRRARCDLRALRCGHIQVAHDDHLRIARGVPGSTANARHELALSRATAPGSLLIAICPRRRPGRPARTPSLQQELHPQQHAKCCPPADQRLGAPARSNAPALHCLLGLPSLNPNLKTQTTNPTSRPRALRGALRARQPAAPRSVPSAPAPVSPSGPPPWRAVTELNAWQRGQQPRSRGTTWVRAIV